MDNTETPQTDFMAVIDSRDVAYFHIEALTMLEASGQRVMLTQHVDYKSVACQWEKVLPEYSNRPP